MKAKNTEEYVNAWTNHVQQLIHVYLDANIDFQIWERDFADMKRIIEKAAKENSKADVFTNEAA